MAFEENKNVYTDNVTLKWARYVNQMVDFDYKCWWVKHRSPIKTLPTTSDWTSDVIL